MIKNTNNQRPDGLFNIHNNIKRNQKNYNYGLLLLIGAILVIPGLRAYNAERNFSFEKRFALEREISDKVTDLMNERYDWYNEPYKTNNEIRDIVLQDHNKKMKAYSIVIAIGGLLLIVGIINSIIGKKRVRRYTDNSHLFQ